MTQSGPLYHSPIGLYEFQAEGVALAYTHPVFAAIWSMGTGKQAPVSEPVLTPDGWRTMGDLEPGDRVIGRDGNPIAVISVHPQQSRTVYRMAFSDGSWTRCGPDHLWTIEKRGVTSRKDGPRRTRWVEETVTTRELMTRGLVDGTGNRRWRIPLVGPVQYPDRPLPIDPYALGVILGDGYVSPRGQVQLTTDKEIIDNLAVHGHRSPHPSDGIETLVTHHWAEELRGLMLAGHRSWEKFVPEIYLRATEQDRRALLAGLIDTDGHPMASGGVEFASTSRVLADAVIELTESLGGSARMAASRQTTYTHDGESRTGRESWRVNVKLNEQPFRLARKMIRWVEPTKYPVVRLIAAIEPEPDEDCVCIRVDAPDGLYVTRHHVVTHNTHLAMALAAILFEDDLIDQVLVVAEEGKIRDWGKRDFPTFTKLTSRVYAGPPDQRARVLAVHQPQVLVSTYETARNDGVVFSEKKGSKAITANGPLLEYLMSKRVLVVYDEFSKLRNRGSRTYIAHEHMLKRLRKRTMPGDHYRVLALTGTPVERNVVNYFNLLRIIDPGRAGTVAQFEKDHVAEEDDYGRITRMKNIRPDEMTDPWVTPFVQRVAPIVMRKRKSDPDICDQFPAKVEEPATYVDLHSRHRELIEAVREVAGEDTGALFGVERQLAAHPLAVSYSKGELAKLITREVGVDGLRAIPSAKTEAMLDWANRLGDESGVIFTFYGQSVLRVLATELRNAGYRVSINHGQMTGREKDASQAAFKAGENQIFLSSDAGARGLNLGIGSALLHYEPSLTWAIHEQRSDRIHRIDSVHESVTIQTLVARDTMDERVLNLMLSSQQAVEDAVDFDLEDGEDGYVSAAMWRRMALLAKAS